MFFLVKGFEHEKWARLLGMALLRLPQVLMLSVLAGVLVYAVCVTVLRSEEDPLLEMLRLRISMVPD